MDIGIGLTVVGVGLTAVGTLAIVLRFLSSKAGTQNGNNGVPASKKDFRALETRLDAFENKLDQRIESGLQRIHDRIDAIDNRCENRGQRLAAIEKEAELRKGSDQ